MKIISILILSTFCMGVVKAGQELQFSKLYAELLIKYRRPPMDIKGVRTVVFDFKTLAEDAKAEDSLFSRTLHAFEQTDPTTFKTPNDEKAFWINAYNLSAMKLVIEHYPIKSIRDAKVSKNGYPWSKPLLGINSSRLSLEGIEQEKLLKRFKDPRIVFAVNCATLSCPDLPAVPFNGDTIDTQLDALMRDFLSNTTKGLRINRETGAIQMSWIFDKHKDLVNEEFNGFDGVVHRYLDEATCAWFEQHQKHITVTYIDHDWMLNDTALATPATTPATK